MSLGSFEEISHDRLYYILERGLNDVSPNLEFETIVNFNPLLIIIGVNLGLKIEFMFPRKMFILLFCAFVNFKISGTYIFIR